MLRTIRIAARVALNANARIGLVARIRIGGIDELDRASSLPLDSPLLGVSGAPVPPPWRARPRWLRVLGDASAEGSSLGPV